MADCTHLFGQWDGSSARRDLPGSSLLLSLGFFGRLRMRAPQRPAGPSRARQVWGSTDCAGHRLQQRQPRPERGKQMDHLLRSSNQHGTEATIPAARPSSIRYECGRARSAPEKFHNTYVTAKLECPDRSGIPNPLTNGLSLDVSKLPFAKDPNCFAGNLCQPIMLRPAAGSEPPRWSTSVAVIQTK